MEKKLWFKAKRYGWGWYPSAWQGWAVLGLYLVGVFVSAFSLDEAIPKSVLMHFVTVFVETLFLIIICYVTGEKPTWRWKGKDLFKKDGATEN